MTEQVILDSEGRIKILQAALGLFKQFGFKSVTMDDIARAAGISKKTLYRYFDNKSMVITETMSWYKDNLCTVADDMLRSAANAVEGFLKVKAHFDEIYKEINPIAVFELQRFYPEGYKQFRDNLQRDVASVKENLERGVAEGLFRPEIDVDILAKFHMECALMVMMPNMIVKDRLDLYHVNKVIAEHFVHGIMTPKGKKIFDKYVNK